MAGKILTIFSHKGGVGKTNLVYNLGYQLSKDSKVLLIDADSQMNLTSAVFGKSDAIDYVNGNPIKDEEQVEKTQILLTEWRDFLDAHLNLVDYISHYVNEGTSPIHKNVFNRNYHNGHSLDLLLGNINTSVIESEWYDIILGSRVKKPTIMDNKPYQFYESIQLFKNNYDFIIIDTPPSSSSIITGLLLSSSDYFLVPVVPNFFSLQAINNLQEIMENWEDLLQPYEQTPNRKGLLLNSKFLGMVINRSKKDVKGENQYTKLTRMWTTLINERLDYFIKWGVRRGKNRVIEQDTFSKIFLNSTPYIIDNIAQFPDNIVVECDKKGIPFLMADNTTFSKEHKDTFNLVDDSYKYIAESLLQNFKK